MSYSIPFNRPCLAGNEYTYIADAIAHGHASGDGPFTKKCHHLLEAELGTMKALLTTSCTHALEMAALLLDCGPEDEIIVPSYTFVSTANAFALRGSKIVFCDVRPDTLNLDEAHFESLITSRTKAVVPVHYAGVPCAMDRIHGGCQTKWHPCCRGQCSRAVRDFPWPLYGNIWMPGRAEFS
jgi:dTDP-4-amino-4,6-dideoxygalactose transaminase